MRFPFIILIWILILTSSEAIACTCSVPKSLKAIQDYEYEISECIFIGEVLEIDSIPSRFTFKILESFKGVENGTIYIGKYDPMCGPIIDETGKWLIYGSFNDENHIVINHCGLTRSFKRPEHNVSATEPPIPPTLPNKKETESEFEKEIIKWRLRAKSDLENEIKSLQERTK